MLEIGFFFAALADICAGALCLGDGHNAAAICCFLGAGLLLDASLRK